MTRASFLAGLLGVTLGLGAVAATTDEIIRAAFDSTNNALKVVGPSGARVVDTAGGTANTIPKFTDANTLGDSSLTDDGTSVTSTAVVRAPSGAVGAPGFAFSTDTDLGFYRPSDNVMHFVAGGIDRIRIQPTGINIAATAGVLGFGGTASPDTALTRTAAGFLGITTGFDKAVSNGAASNPATNNVRFYTREDIDQGSGTGTADCALVARLASGTEVLIQVLVSDAGC